MNSHQLAQQLLQRPDIPVYFFNGGDFVSIEEIQLMDSKDLPAEEDKNATEEKLGFPPKLICLI
jgi:hypothetical protein